MQIFSFLFTLLVFEKANADLWKSWKPIFKKYIKQSCGTQTDDGLVVEKECVDELLGIDALLAVISNMNSGGTFHYQIQFEDVDGQAQSFEFAQSEDPFTESEDDDTVTMVNWNGRDMTSQANFFKDFKKVKRKVFWWLRRKFPDDFAAVDGDSDEDGERRRRRDDELDELYVSRRRAEEIADEDELMGSFGQLIQVVKQHVPSWEPASVALEAGIEETGKNPKGK